MPAETRAHRMEIPEMVYTLSSRRLTSFLAIAVLALAGLVVATPLVAQEPGGRFRVLVPNPEVEDGVRERFARDVANEVKKLIDGMTTHRSMPKRDLNDLLKKFKLRERDLNCVTSQQLAMQGGIELVMCGTIRQAQDGMETEAYFITQDQTQFDVPPVHGSNAKEVAQQIFNSFETFVTQLSLVHYCNEDLAASQWDGALEKCSEALELNPTSQSAMYGRGYALMQLEDYDQSLVSLQNLLELNPIHQEGLQAAGFVTAKLGMMEESREYFNQYLELNPGNIQVRLTIALNALKAGDPEGALEIVEQGLVDGADDLQLIEYAGYFASSAAAEAEAANKEANGDEAAMSVEARELYEKAADYLGRVYAEEGDEVKADVLVQLMNSTSKLGRTDEALEIGAKAVVSKPDEAAVWQAYAAALRSAGKVKEAVEALDSVLALDPGITHIRAQQGQWLLQADEVQAAAEAFKKAVDAGELDAEGAGMNIFAVGINEKFQKGDQAGAVPYFEAAKEFVTKPESLGMINFFHGLVYYYRGMEVGKPETLESAQQALPIFQRARELFNQSSAYGDTSPDAAKSLADHIQNTEVYIEIQEALIKRGR